MTNVIELSDEQYADLTRSARSVESPYLEDLRNATVGKGYGILILEDGPSSRTILNNIDKAATALKVQVQKVTRQKGDKPMVVFKVLGPQTTKTAAASVTAPVGDAAQVATETPAK